MFSIKLEVQYVNAWHCIGAHRLPAVTDYTAGMIGPLCMLLYAILQLTDCIRLDISWES